MSELKAKKVSLFAKIIAGIVLIICSILKWLNIFPNCDISEICKVCFTILGLFGTVDLNIALDKFTKKNE